jgi:hypothetical protein
MARCDSQEFTEWKAYYRISPFGAHRDNLHAGIVAATLVNINRSSRSEPMSASDFVLRFGEPVQSGEDMMANFKRFKAACERRYGNV